MSLRYFIKVGERQYYYEYTITSHQEKCGNAVFSVGIGLCFIPPVLLLFFGVLLRTMRGHVRKTVSQNLI